MKENWKSVSWILALVCSIGNAASASLPFICGKDPVETFFIRTFHGFNLMEVSGFGTGVVIAPMIYIALLFCQLPYRDKVWLWVFNIVFQSVCYSVALIDAKKWLELNTIDIERCVGVTVYPVFALFAAIFIFEVIHNKNTTQDITVLSVHNTSAI